MGIKIKLIKSVSGSDLWQRATITGLGLKKFGDERLLKDTPAIRGMIFKVQHLLKQENVKEDPKPSKRRKTRSIRVRDASRKAAEAAQKAAK
jgi:large subunit ribosomal protein L30